MPNPKTGTVIMDVAKAIDEIKKENWILQIKKEHSTQLESFIYCWTIKRKLYNNLEWNEKS